MTVLDSGTGRTVAPSRPTRLAAIQADSSRSGQPSSEVALLLFSPLNLSLLRLVRVRLLGEIFPRLGDDLSID